MSTPEQRTTIVVDYYCQLPGCGRGYLGSLRFAGTVPLAGTVYKRGKCQQCRRWQWVDVAGGIVRVTIPGGPQSACQRSGGADDA